MITLVVQLLIAFPKLGRLFLDIKREYVKELVNRRQSKHSDLINDWMRDTEGEQDSNVPPKTEQPRL